MGEGVKIHIDVGAEENACPHSAWFPSVRAEAHQLPPIGVSSTASIRLRLCWCQKSDDGSTQLGPHGL
jgi:hypothetical protein